jgi:hypothetical protein
MAMSMVFNRVNLHSTAKARIICEIVDVGKKLRPERRAKRTIRVFAKPFSRITLLNNKNNKTADPG